MVDALFVENGLASAVSAVAGGRPAAGGMRHAGAAGKKRGVGPIQTVRIPHGTEGIDLHIQVQAVVKQDIGVGCSMFILLHPFKPKCGMADFRSWLPSSPIPVAPSAAAFFPRVPSGAALSSKVSGRVAGMSFVMEQVRLRMRTCKPALVHLTVNACV